MLKGRPSSVNSNIVPRKVIKKKHNSPKQIFILSRDALMERKGRSALTILMVLVGGALMVAINGMSEGSAAFTNKQLVSLAPNVIFVSPGLIIPKAVANIPTATQIPTVSVTVVGPKL